MTHANASACAGKFARRAAYTTGQVARLLGCSDYTVCRWIDAGRLPGHRVPAARGGRPARRVFHADLVAFCRAAGAARALEALEGPPPPPGPVALCGLPDALTAVLASRLGQGAAAWYPDLLTLGLAFTRVPPPRAVVLGGCHGRAAALDAVRALTGLDPRPLLVGLPGEDDAREAWAAAGCDRVFQMPCDPQKVAEVLTQGGRADG
jgi:excisionase family DNA binding protein